MKKKLEVDLAEAEEEYLLTTSQLRNISHVANSSIPKKKQKKFDNLVATASIKRINARNRFYSLHEKFEKQKAKAKAKKK